MVSKKRNRKKTYTKGELNRIVDCVFHPLYHKNEIVRLLDGVVHSIVEKNPPMSLKKLFKYNSWAILRKIRKTSRSAKGR